MKTNSKIITVIALVMTLSAGGGWYYHNLTSKIQSTQVADNQKAINPVAQNLNQQAPPNSKSIAKGVASNAIVELSSATNTARFVTAPRGESLDHNRNPQLSNSANAMRFLLSQGEMFGITNPDEQLMQVTDKTDEYGYEHIKYQQMSEGLRVFAGELIVHFDPQNNLYAVNGVIVPDINVDPSPRVSTDKAGQTALAFVAHQQPDAQGIAPTNTELMLYRSNLIQGTPGSNHLAYQVTVSNGSNVLEYVYIDAHTGKFIDQISGVHGITAKNGIHRRAYDLGGDLLNLTSVYPGNPIWVEGNTFPTGNQLVDRALQATLDTYNLYKTAFNYVSYDNKNGPMDVVTNWNDLNAFEVGSDLPQLTVFGADLTVEDVVAHEWGHAYTSQTDNLVYAYQPGALNESNSDIFGETTEQINSPGPFNPRPDGTCTILTGNQVAGVKITAPASITGTDAAGTAGFGPPLTTPLSGNIMLVNDGAGVTSDACEPTVNTSAINGNIALIDRGSCDFSAKVKKAQDAGAIGAIIVNNQGNYIQSMTAGADAAAVTIPSVFIGQGNGQLIKSQLAANTIVSGILLPTTAGTDNSVRWLLGNQAGVAGTLRDMWSPTCLAQAGKVSDTDYYSCAASSDSGGAHQNDSIPNHAYALLVDGGNYNNQRISGIGLTKALHIYWRAKVYYQHGATQFPDHADALDQACQDLVGQTVRDLKTGALMKQNTITRKDCMQVSKASAAVELRKPVLCTNVSNILAENPPRLCSIGSYKDPVFLDNFKNELNHPQWTTSHDAVDPSGFLARDWKVTTGSRQLGSPTPVYFGREQGFSLNVVATGDDCSADQASVLHLDSPAIRLPRNGGPINLAFDHWVHMPDDYFPQFGGAFDGGNLKISVNGRPYQIVGSSAFTFNPYNTILFTPDLSDDPMAGQSVFSGADVQLVDPFNRSILNLSQYAQPGDTIRLRFDLGTDFCTTSLFGGDDIGWYIKKVQVYQCKPGYPRGQNDDGDD